MAVRLWFSCLLLLASTAWAARDPAYEAALHEKLKAIDPSLLPAFVQAASDTDEGRLEEALNGYRKVVESAPAFAAAQRRLCATLVGLGRADEGFGACEKALSLEASWENQVAMAQLLLQRKGPGDLAQSRKLTAEVLAHHPAESEAGVTAKALECVSYFAQEDRPRAHTCTERLLEAAPEDPRANNMAIESAASRGEWLEASARLEKARPVMSDEEYQRVRGILDKAEPSYIHYGIPFLKVFAGWLAVFAALVVFGLALSWITLRMAKRLATQRDASASGAAVMVRRIYKAVLGVGSIFYFVSLPLVALVTLALGGGIIYGFIAVGRIPIKLVVILALLVLVTLWGLVKSLFVRISDEDPGELLDLSRAPRFHQLLKDVAAKVGTRPVDTVFITPGTDLAVFERGGTLKRLTGNAERCLVLGVGVLDGFKLAGFRSVLAHEYGHFSNKDTAGGNLALATRVRLLQMGRALVEGGAASAFNPAWWFFRAYLWAFLRISQGASRLQEILADRFAIFAYGSAAFEEGYTHVIRQSVRFDAHTQTSLKEVIEGEKALANLYRFVPAAPADAQQVEEAIEQELSREPSPFDSHPASRDRLQWARALAITTTGTGEDAQEVWSLFDDREPLERQMTDVIRRRIGENHGVIIPDAAA